MSEPTQIRLDEERYDDELEPALEQALAALDAGGLVIAPTETVYGIGGRVDRPAAVAQLRRLKEQREEDPFTLHIGDPEIAWRHGHGSPHARRLARAYWPGPLTMVLDCVPEVARELTGQERETLGFRVVAQKFTTELLQRCPVPLYMSSANPSGVEPPIELARALELCGKYTELAIDGGPCHVGKPSSVVHVRPTGQIRVLREAALEEKQILARAATLVLFLCSGNTCRSPMAEHIARALWAEELGVAPEDLVREGILVASAGCSTGPGAPASAHAITAAGEAGFLGGRLDLTGHRSRPLEPALLARASRIYAMGGSHVFAAQQMLEEIGGPFEEDALPPRLLAAPREVADPFGGDLATYQRARDEIAAAIRELELPRP
jgi:L-threonylcarbamoyladenylate synthase